MKKFSKLLKKLLILLNKLLKFKFTSRNMFGSTGHTVAELDYFFSNWYINIKLTNLE